ncbi:MAG: transposase, partial [Pseudomonadota bacterium]
MQREIDSSEIAISQCIATSKDLLDALAGLAPMARDSGAPTGKRRIGGGRESPRDVLYMAGLSAARNDPPLRAFSDRIRANVKVPKQSIIAVTCKFLIILNAMITENRAYETPHQHTIPGARGNAPRRA